MRLFRYVVPVGVLALFLVACSILPGAVNAALNGEWRLTAGTHDSRSIPIVAGSPITMKIDGEQVRGSAACNTYGGTMRVNGTSISISGMSVTEMACRDPVMASEAAYLAALALATTAASHGDSLVLSGPQVELAFVLVPPVADADLTGTTWVLDSLISGGAVSSTVGEQATLQFAADGTMSGTTGCRIFFGRYSVSGTEVAVSDFGTDKRACTTDLVGQDEHVMAVLYGGFDFAIDGDRLTLTAGEGLGYRAAAAGSQPPI